MELGNDFDSVSHGCVVELLPTDPNAAIGQPLEMTCTLKEEFMTSNNCNSSDIFFTIRNVSKEKKIQVDGMVSGA